MEPLKPNEFGAFYATWHTFALSQHVPDTRPVQNIPLHVFGYSLKTIAAHFMFPPADSLRNVFRGKFLPSENFIRMTNGELP